jgi:hypothetical protein
MASLAVGSTILNAANCLTEAAQSYLFAFVTKRTRKHRSSKKRKESPHGSLRHAALLPFPLLFCVYNSDPDLLWVDRLLRSGSRRDACAEKEQKASATSRQARPRGDAHAGEPHFVIFISQALSCFRGQH